MPFRPHMLFIRPRDGVCRVPLHSVWNNSRSLHDYRALARVREGVVFNGVGARLKLALSNIERRTSNSESLREQASHVECRTEELPAEGLEPTRPCGHWILSPARLPIPPRRLFERTERYRLRAQAQVARTKADSRCRSLASQPLRRRRRRRRRGFAPARPWCWRRSPNVIKEGAGEFEHRPAAAVKSASGNMHRLQAPRSYWRRGVVKGDRRVAVTQARREIRRYVIHRKIACLERCRIDGIAQVNIKVNRWSEYHTAATCATH